MSVTDKRAETDHQHGNGSWFVNVGHELCQAVVGHEWSEAPLGKKSKRKARDATDERQRRRATACEKAAHETGRQNERVKALPGNPKEGEETSPTADDRTQ